MVLMRSAAALAEEQPMPPRSPERQRLHDAIAARDAAGEALAAARRAVTRGDDAVAVAERRLEAAAEQVESARAQRALEVADGVAPAAANALRISRSEMLDAEDSVEIALTAYAELGR